MKYQPTLQTAASGEARFDHDPVTGESKGLLIEEARTNLDPSSNTINWQYNINQTSNAGIAPDGTQTADLCAYTNSGGAVGLLTGGKPSSSGDYTWSVFVKKFGDMNIIRVQDNDAGAYADFNINTGEVDSGNAARKGIYSVGNGWYRVWMSSSVSTNATYFQIYGYDSIGSISNTINGHNGIFVWGSQVEQGAFPTSYIPTSGSTVTRSSDNCLLQNDFTWFNPSKSTLYAEYQEPNTLSDSRIAQIQSTDTSEQIALYSDGASGANNASRNYVSVNGGAQMQTNGFSVAKGSVVKTALAIETNNGAASVNGETPQTDTSMIVVGGEPFAYLSIGSMQGGAAGQHLCSTIKKIAYYPQRLSNATLQAMTEE